MLHSVEAAVPADHVFGQGDVALGDGLDRVGHLRLRQAAHARDLGLELAQLLAEELQGVFVHAHGGDSGRAQWAELK